MARYWHCEIVKICPRPALFSLRLPKSDRLLGGNVWKKRLKQNRNRSIVLTKPKDFWVFAYMFAKSDKDNLDADELAGFKNLSTNYGVAGLAGMVKLVAAKTAMEICHECEDKEFGSHKET
ncbi:hypothetical protein D0817_25375 [Flavobacterium cupreum]|uniref:Uncharacterized protein n=1 Tax=Flavobacterium cupreum TaxID=2133766 RepID=A0A433ZZV0_9FLAO|nr:hypothetical protein D0817_25375 [Flavobacterium cupreum]